MGLATNVNIENEWSEVMNEALQIALVVFLLTVCVANFFARVVRLKPRVNLAVLCTLLLVLLWQVWAIYDSTVDELELPPECTVYERDPQVGQQVKIIMFFDQPFGMLAEDHNRRYAYHKGYAFERHLGCKPRKRAMQWAKIALLRLEAKRVHWHVQWLVWIDADAVMANHRIFVFDDFLNKIPDHIHLVVGGDLEGLNRPINTGWIAVRVTREAEGLLTEIWHKGAKLRKRWMFGHEQEALTVLHKTRPDVAKMVQIESKRVRLFSESDKTLQGDEMVLHAAGWPREAKSKGLRAMIQRTLK
jgi:hypothetical protein